MRKRSKVLSIFHLAVKREKSQIVQTMLISNAVSSGEKNIELHNSIASGNLEMVKLILELTKNAAHKLNLDKRLCQAIYLGRESIVQLLLQHGANPSASNYRGHPALKIAIQSSQNSTIVDYLLQSGADLTYVDPYGNSIAMLAASQPSTDILQSVLQYGAQPNLSLTCAVSCNFHNHVRLLLLQGVDVNEINDAGITPLIASIPHGNMKIIKLLIQFGANPNLQDIDGNTALMHAALHSGSELFCMLVKSGATTRIKNYRGENPYDILIKRFGNSL